MRFWRPKRTAPRLMGHVLFIAIGASSVGACAELEVGAQAYKSLNRAATEPAASGQPGLPSKPKRIVIENPDAELRGDLDPNFRSAPEVFFATGVAKWDGARTLRGIWVAHPLARQARRVRIVNRETRQAVDGALFKRDTTLAGPSLLVSSDAAQALGLVPGVATALQIYALERAETPPENGVGETVAAGSGSSGPDAADAGEESVAEIATYATERAAGQRQHEQAAKTPFGKTAVRATADGGAVVTAERLPAPQPADGTPAGSPGQTPEPVTAAEQGPAIAEVNGTAARAAKPAEPDEAALAQITAAVEAQPSPAATEVTGTPDKAEAEPLEPESKSASGSVQAETTVSRAPAAAPDKKETPARIAAANSNASVSTTEPTPEPQAAVRSPSTQSAQSSTAEASARPAKPYIQLGVFGVPENATRLIERLRKAGLPSLTKTIPRDDGSTLIRVMAGPFDDRAAQQRAFEIIKKFGIKDAIAVRG